MPVNKIKAMNKCFKILIILFVFTVTVACETTPPPLSERVSSNVDLNKEVSFTGVIESFTLDLYQEGTHQIKTEKETVIIQSSQLNLNNYLNKKVSITGSYDRNFDSKSPVFSVREIELLEGEDQVNWISFKDDQIGLSFQYPDAWSLVDESDYSSFKSNGTEWLKVENIDQIDEKWESEIAQKEGQDGVPVTIGSFRSLRFIDQGEIRMYVPNLSRNRLYKLTFNDESQVQKDRFYQLLETIDTSEETRTISGEPCGGLRNQQCPENFFCELESDAIKAVGQCMPIDQNKSCPLVLVPAKCQNYEVKTRNKNNCPLSYTCLDVPGENAVNEEVEVKEASSDSNTSESDNSVGQTSDLDTENEIVQSFSQKKLLSNEAIIKTYEWIQDQSLLGVIYEMSEVQKKTYFTYKKTDDSYEFTQQATYKSGEEQDWVLESGEVVRIHSDRTLITAENQSVKTIPSGKRLYENQRQKFSMLYPSNWYYRSFGAIENSIWTGGFSEKSLDSITDAKIEISIQDNTAQFSLKESNGKVTATQFRDEDTHFVITGPSDSKDLIEEMVKSISTNR